VPTIKQNKKEEKKYMSGPINPNNNGSVTNNQLYNSGLGKASTTFGAQSYVAATPANSTVSSQAASFRQGERNYAATTSSVAAARPIASAPATVSKAKSVATRPVSTGAVTVKRGQTLSQIAQAHHTTVAAVAKLNGIADPNKIMAGQKLTFGGSSARQASPVKRVAVPTLKKKR
jgi:LysM repeat protein